MTYQLYNIENAYRKLKSYVYYDNFSLLLRQQIAEYESEADFELKLQRFIDFINDPFSETGKVYFNALCARIDYWTLPKKFSRDDLGEDFILTNKFTRDFYLVEKVNYFIKAPIEIHLISMLWILNEGFTLANLYSKNNYAYALEFDRDKNEIVDGLRLFKPYFEQYQRWRDQAIDTALQFVEKETDVVILGLDIKEYFYNIQLNKERRESLETVIKKHLKKKKSDSLVFTSLLFDIHDCYVSKLPGKFSDNKLIPIGILSSGIIANWFLTDFDSAIIEKLSPAFYGRYVDDILIVLPNTKIKDVPKAGSDSKTPLEYLFQRLFVARSILNKVEDNSNTKPEVVYNWVGNESIKIQKEKVSVYAFEGKESKAVLDKFKQNIQKNSSAFWFLPDEDGTSDDFDESVYELTYSDTINKLRSVKEIKQNKYGASVFLAKKIKISLMSENKRNDDDEKTKKQILTFFKGRMNLEFSSIWEKALTYFVVNNEKEAFGSFFRETIYTLDKIEYRDEQGKIDKKTTSEIKSSLFEYLMNCVALSLSLNPSFNNLKLPVRLKSTSFHSYQDVYDNQLSKIIQELRKTNLIRHNYVTIPLLNFTHYSDKTNSSLINPDVIGKLTLDELAWGELKTKFAPRYVYIFEFIHLENIRILLHTSSNTSSKEELKINIGHLFLAKNSEGSYENSTLSSAFRDFFSINYVLRKPERYLSNPGEEEKKNADYKNLRDNYFLHTVDQNYNQKIIYDTITIPKSGKIKKKLSIAVANTKVLKENILLSLFGSANTSRSRRKQIIDILNQTEKNKANVLVLPEVSVPFRWLPLLADESRRKHRLIIAGLEHIRINNVCYNLIATCLPFEYKGIKDVLVVLRVKNHYSPHEIKMITEKGKKYPVPDPATYNRFIWNDIYFSVYNCYELADIEHRSIFKSKVDLLFASEYNPDTNYFSNIVESVTRDLHCYFVQVNSSDFGDSRITVPKKSFEKDVLRLKGGINDVVLIGELDINELREFQTTRIIGQDTELFKNTPPNYDHSEAEKRANRD